MTDHAEQYDAGRVVVNRWLDDRSPRQLAEYVSDLTARISLSPRRDGANVDVILLEYARAVYDLMRLDHPQRCRVCGAALTFTPTGRFCHRCTTGTLADHPIDRGDHVF
jgi:hypothetical protein